MKILLSSLCTAVLIAIILAKKGATVHNATIANITKAEPVPTKNETIPPAVQPVNT